MAMELAILRPSFTWKLNPEGYSPMHLALQHEHYHIVTALMIVNPKLIRVQGRCGITPLHYVAGKVGDNQQERKELLELLAKFLFACKSSIEVLTNQCEIVVHVAAKSHNNKALKVLFGWLRRVDKKEIAYWKDQDGNSVFDIVPSIEPQLEQQHKQQNLEQQLKISLRYWINKGHAKEEALESFQNLAKLLSRRRRGEEKKDVSLSELFSKELTVFEIFSYWLGHQDESARNIILTVSTLIATATYQAVLSPPGGYWQDNSSNPTANSTVVTANSSRLAVEKPHQAGNIILSDSKLYQFTALNSLVFLASIITISITAISLLPRTFAVLLLMFFLDVSFYTTATIGFPTSEAVGASLTKGIYLSLQVVAFLVPLILCMSYHNFKRRIVDTGRCSGNFLDWKDRK